MYLTTHPKRIKSRTHTWAEVAFDKAIQKVLAQFYFT